MKPITVADVDIAFGGNIWKLMPAMAKIPSEFHHGSNKWNKFMSDWFYRGLKNLNVTPKKGIDEKAALRHLAAILKSWEPKHEHKEAAVAYLASLWFEDVTYETVK
jgi:hypothetical protein